MSSNDEGLDKSTLLLMTLGADEAAEVLKQLGPRDVQKLGAAMAVMPAQSREKLEALLDEHAGLERALAGPAVHADAAQARKLGRRYAELGPVVAAARELVRPAAAG